MDTTIPRVAKHPHSCRYLFLEFSQLSGLYLPWREGWGVRWITEVEAGRKGEGGGPEAWIMSVVLPEQVAHFHQALPQRQVLV